MIPLDLCRALLYTQANLKSSVDALKSKKQQDELPEEDEDDKTGKSYDKIPNEGIHFTVDVHQFDLSKYVKMKSNKCAGYQR